MHERLRRHNEGLEEKVLERTQELEMAQREILERLALAAEYRDDITGKHAQRVGGVSGLVALELGMDVEKAALLQQAAPLHDVGKIGIPDTILLKPGRLTQDEITIIRTHTTIGARILDGSRFDLLHLAREIALSHHEWWDGSGYEGWVGTDIPLSGRIVAVADVFDSLSHERPYKPAIALPGVVEIMLAESETHFDPEVFRAFLNLLERGDLEEIRSMRS
jgi:putative two-component system response regulator